jgi:hypothetical protein
MATVTLGANSNYSALTVASGDTIDCNGFALTINSQPAEINVSVTSPGKAGTVSISGTLNLSTWSFTAGTVVMISTIPSGCAVGSVTGGSATNAACVTTNSGTIGTVNGGAGGVANGCTTNNGTITGNVTGGSGTNSRGVQQNNGIIGGNVTGGSGTTAHGVLVNAGTITGNVAGGSTSSSQGLRDNTSIIVGNVTGGSAATAHGISAFNSGEIRGSVTGGSSSNVFGVVSNRGTILGGATGGSAAGANAIQVNSGIVLGSITDGTANAVGSFEGTHMLLNGPDVTGRIASPITTIYSSGAMNPAATLPVGVTVVTLSSGTAGFTGIRGVSRRLGT